MPTSRISREEVLMESARLWAKRSTCSRARNGASVIRDGRLLMSGYNGAPAGMDHCVHECTCRPTVLGAKPTYHHTQGCGLLKPCLMAVHAEQNALLACAKYGVATEDAEMYCTMMPCVSCAMSIISAGIVVVTFEQDYRIKEGMHLLTKAGVAVVQYGA